MSKYDHFGYFFKCNLFLLSKTCLVCALACFLHPLIHKFAQSFAWPSQVNCLQMFRKDSNGAVYLHGSDCPGKRGPEKDCCVWHNLIWGHPEFDTTSFLGSYHSVITALHSPKQSDSIMACPTRTISNPEIKIQNSIKHSASWNGKSAQSQFKPWLI